PAVPPHQPEPAIAPPAQATSLPHWPELSFPQPAPRQEPRSLESSFSPPAQRPAPRQGAPSPESTFAQPSASRPPHSFDFSQAPTAHMARPFEQSFAQPVQPPPSFAQQGPGTQGL